MKVFKTYAAYYDLLNSDKDYASEAVYVHSIIQKYVPETKSILDLGCGTGSYEVALASKGYFITGIDLSEEMLTIAKSKTGKKCNFFLGDIRKVRLCKYFDVVISLFHVMSYQVKNSDLFSAMKTAYEHLDNGGIFIFDFWNGPGVLSDQPAVREKTVKKDQLKVTRKATPTMFPDENRVDVLYNVCVEDSETNTRDNFQEVHSVRYLFISEIEIMLKNSGFSLLAAFEWMKYSPLKDSRSWNGIVVAKKGDTLCA